MFNNLKSRRNKKSGFTLIELLVVILILGILIAVAIPLYLTSVRNAGTRTVQANIKTIAQASQAYRVKNGAYPAAADLVTEGDLTQPVDQMGPTGVAYTMATAGGVLTITATESTDRFGGTGSTDTLSYNLTTGVWTPSAGWSL